MNEQRHIIDYNKRYHQGYMEDFTNLYERCRLVAVRELLQSRRLFPIDPPVLLDIACGQARYNPVIREAFPTTRIIGADISTTGLELAWQRHPKQAFVAAMGEALPLADNSIDMVFSIETLEHVADARATIHEWGRVLKPGGKILFTTPCANRFSLEWFIMYFTGGFQPSDDGIGRFRWDEPGHLRRLASSHVEGFFAEAGLKVTLTRFRTHFFTTVARVFLRRRPLNTLAFPVAAIDWRLFRRLPNGASMIVIGEKTAV
jgi:ubiquinone/menaquinone biosynthesis C-methylase UbiE